MVEKEHFTRLKQGVDAWNSWRKKNSDIILDLSYINLRYAALPNSTLNYSNLYSADLTGANLSKANLSRANLTSADLSKANLTRADLTYANLTKVNLTGANLTEANLSYANLLSADLTGANFGGAFFSETVLTNIDLSAVKGLETCGHLGPSVIDHRTLAMSGKLPLSFLRGVGLPDNYIDYIPSLFNQPIQFYSWVVIQK